MKSLPEELERIGAERLEAEREVARTYRREMLRAALECVASCLIGLLLMAAGLHTTDLQLGKIFFFGGMLVGYTGITLSLFSAYRRGEQRGDW